MSQFFEELKRRKVVRAGIAYLVAAWVLLQVTNEVAQTLELAGWIPKTVLYSLTIGFFLTLVFAWVFELTSRGIRRDRGKGSGENGGARTGQKIEHGVIGILTMALLGIGIFWYQGSDERWARDVAFPEIEQYSAEGRWEEAYGLAKQVEARLPNSEALDVIWGSISWLTSIPSRPPGATVYRRPYADPDAEWERLGITPLNDIHIPLGPSVLRMELDGHAPLLRIIGGETDGTTDLQVQESPSVSSPQISPGAYIFDPADSLPDGMVRVPGESMILNGEPVEIREFNIDRYEVSNRQFYEFVLAGGYRRQDLWEHEFISDGEVITWAQAMETFVDSTGRPGPHTWEAGTYPDGEDDHPVAGVSWYEAAAYAKFVGRELPTVHHWRRAFAAGMLAWIMPASNLDSDGLTPVGEYQGMSWTGTFDMAGSVREWCQNLVADQRVILGGSWQDPHYVVQTSIFNPGSLPPIDRSAMNGFRLAISRDEPSVTLNLRNPVIKREQISISEPVSDAVFDAYLNNFAYDRVELNPMPEGTQSARHWTRERISIATGNAGERLPLYLYLPKSGSPPFQTIIYWPTITALVTDSVDRNRVQLDFALKNGRAVVLPILDGTFERRWPQFPDWATVAGRELVFEQVRDMRRSIDYLETRSDIDSEALSFYGFSWGGRLGPIAFAAEPRIKVGVLNMAGLQHMQRPETNVLNYLPRVKIPVLQFNGRYDTDFDFDTSAKPYFEYLGSKEKNHVVEETGHFVSQSTVVRETLDWLDKFLGPPVEQLLISNADQ